MTNMKMAKINSYTDKAQTSVTLPKEFDSTVNLPLLAQAVHVYRNRLHLGTAIKKTRGEVNRTKAKVYRQKGTGNARHGAKSAPIFVGGGVTHGPMGVKRVLELSKKMRQAALDSALAFKADKGDVSMFNATKLEKTKDANAIVENVRKGENAAKSKMLFVLSEKNASWKTPFANIDRVRTARYQDLNAYSVFTAAKLVFDESIFAKDEPTKKKGGKKSS